MLMSRNGLVAALTVLACVGGAMAQGADKQPGPRPALRGPEVKDREVPGVREAFAEGEQGKFMRGERMPMPVFLEALKVLNAEDAPATIRATPKQEETVRAMVEKFNQDRREYMQAHQAEMRQMRQAGGPGRRPGANGPDGQPGMDEMNPPGAPPAGENGAGDQRARRQANAEKMRELEQGAPKVEDLYTKVWEELTDTQRKAVDARLDVWRQERSKEREDNYVRQKLGKKGVENAPAARPGEPMPPGAPGAGEQARRPLADDATRAERRQRLMRMFEQLPAEEQDRILERLEQRIKDGTPLAPGRPGAPGRGAGAPKPAPGVDRVRVPDPNGADNAPPKKKD